MSLSYYTAQSQLKKHDNCYGLLTYDWASRKTPSNNYEGQITFHNGYSDVTKLKDGRTRIQSYVPPSDKKSYYIDREGNEKF